MRKEKLVTRRIEWSEVEILGFNIETSSAETRKFTLPSKITEPEKIMTFIRKNFADEIFTPVKITDIFIKSELRGMPESVFIANSYPIENRNNAAIKEN